MITIWHNPRCSKSRQTLALIEPHGPVNIRRYLEDTPSLEELVAVQALLGIKAIEMMRPKEARFRELGLDKAAPDATLLAAMAENPVLIERPIVLANGRATLGRPPEAVLDIL